MGVTLKNAIRSLMSRYGKFRVGDKVVFKDDMGLPSDRTYMGKKVIWEITRVSIDPDGIVYEVRSDYFGTGEYTAWTGAYQEAFERA